MGIETPSCPVGPLINLTHASFSKTGEGPCNASSSPFLHLLFTLLQHQGVAEGEVGSVGHLTNLNLITNQGPLLRETFARQNPGDEEQASNENKLLTGSDSGLLAVLSCLIQAFPSSREITAEPIAQCWNGPVLSNISEKGIFSQGGILNPEPGCLSVIEGGEGEGMSRSLSANADQAASRSDVHLKSPSIENTDFSNLLPDAKNPSETKFSGFPSTGTGKHEGEWLISSRRDLTLAERGVLPEPAAQAPQVMNEKPELSSSQAFLSRGGSTKKLQSLTSNFSGETDAEMMEKQASEKEAIPGPQEKIALPKENQYQAAARPETRFGSDPQIKDLNGQLREPVGREIIKQIVEKAYLSTGKETATLKLQLKPEFLGKLDLVISLEKGLLHARFLAENPAVANLIETRLPDLRQSLEQQGISWHQVSVSVDSQAGSGEFSQTGPEAQSLPQHDLLPYAGVHEGNSERRENGASTAGLLGLVDYLV